MDLASSQHAHKRFLKTVYAISSSRTKWARLPKLQPRNRFEAQAKVLVEAVASYSAIVTAVSGYTTLIQSIVPPTLQKQQSPSGPGVPSDVYDQYYEYFIPEWNSFTNVVRQWMVPGLPNTGLYQALANIPNQILTSNYTIGTALSQMASNPAGSTTYNNALNNLTNTVNQLLNQLQGPLNDLYAYSGSLSSSTESVIAQANSGALNAALVGYQSEIDELNTLIQQAQDKVTDNGISLLEDTAKLGGFLVMGLVGLAGVFTPEPSTTVLGAITVVAAGVGFAGTVVDMVSVGISVAEDKAAISTYRNSIDVDGRSIVDLGAIINQINGFAGMNAAAIAALEQVASGYQTLLTSLTDMLGDAEYGDITQAATAWNDMVAAATNMSENATYYWPDCYSCYECKTIAPTTNGMFALAADGSINSYSNSSRVWTRLSGTAFSLAATNNVTVRISGQPLSVSSPTNTQSTYHAAILIGSNWTDISDFPVANISAFGSAIYAVRSGYNGGATRPIPGSQLSEVLKYSGSGKNWTSLGIPDPEDIPAFIEAFPDGVLVTTLKFGRCYFWMNGSWTRLGSDSVCLLNPATVQTGLYGGFSLIDTSFNSYISSPGDPTLYQTDNQIVSTALNNEFVQFVVGSSGELSSIVRVGHTNNVTAIQPEVLSIFGDVTGVNFYYVAYSGSLHRIQGSGTSSTISDLPAIPS